MNELVLKDFSGTIEITADAWELKKKALAAAKPIAKVETPLQQQGAVEALRLLKEIRSGMEATRKAVKAPVLQLGRKIDETAYNFMAEIEKQYGRLSGLINHYQRKEAQKKAEAQDVIQSQENLAQELKAKAARIRGNMQVEVNNGKREAMRIEAERLEKEAFDLEMTTELTVVPGVEKPKGLVVRNRINFQVLDAIVFCQAWPNYWKWHPETETLKLDRMKILDELNREDGKGEFHMTRFPEELSKTEDRRLVQPAGLRVFEETKSHIR